MRTCRRLAALAACVVVSSMATGCTVQSYYGLRTKSADTRRRNVLLRWEAFSPPPSWSDGTDGPPVRVLRVTYDLRVTTEMWGDTAYEREGLPDPEHRTETALHWQTLYCWRVRARIETDRGLRLGPWSERQRILVDGRSPTVDLAPDQLASFRVW